MTLAPSEKRTARQAAAAKVEPGLLVSYHASRVKTLMGNDSKCRRNGATITFWADRRHMVAIHNHSFGPEALARGVASCSRRADATSRITGVESHQFIAEADGFRCKR